MDKWMPVVMVFNDGNACHDCPFQERYIQNAIDGRPGEIIRTCSLLEKQEDPSLCQGLTA